MPTLSFQSKVRTVSESCTLNMIIEHRLFLGEPSDVVHLMKQPIPQGLDVLLASPLMITISGAVNSVNVSSQVVLGSHIARHFMEYLRMNADELGINAVSDGYIQEESDIMSFTCTGSRPFSPEPERLSYHANLVGLNIRYIWQLKENQAFSETKKECKEAEVNPFSPNLPLPYLSMINNTIERLMTFQVVKRYPLIFGPWCKQLAVEEHFFTSIYASIRSMIARSAHSNFSITCKTLLKLCERRVEASRKAGLRDLLDWVGSDIHDLPGTALDHERVFISCMDKFYRIGLKRPLFKGLSSVCNLTDRESLQEEALLNLDSGMDTTQVNDDDFIDEASAFKTFFVLEEECAGTQRYYPEDMDLYFAGETGSEFNLQLLAWFRSNSATIILTFGNKNSDLDSSVEVDTSSEILSPPIHFPIMPLRGEEDEEEEVSEESMCEDFPFAYNPMTPSECDWSDDTNPSQGKTICLPLRITPSPDSPVFREIDLDPLDDVASSLAHTEIPRGKYYVDEKSLCESSSYNLPGSELRADHGIIQFEDESTSLASEYFNEGDKNWHTIALENRPRLSDENFKRIGMDSRFLPENGHGNSLGTGANLAQRFLAVDFD